jgi:hypothetical protein
MEEGSDIAAGQRPLLAGAELLALAAARPAAAAVPDWEALAAEPGLVRAESLDELAYVLGPEGALFSRGKGDHLHAAQISLCERPRPPLATPPSAAWFFTHPPTCHRRSRIPDDLPAAVLAGDRAAVRRLLVGGVASPRDLADALGLARALGWQGDVEELLLVVAAATTAAAQPVPSAAGKNAADGRGRTLLTAAWCMGLAPAGFDGPSASLEELLGSANGGEVRTVRSLLQALEAGCVVQVRAGRLRVRHSA